MATKARRITIEVGGDDVGAGKTFREAGSDADKLGQKLRGVSTDAKKGFDRVEQEADSLGSKFKAAGQDAGNKLSQGVQSGVSGVGSAVEGAGASAADAVSSGFDVNSIADSLSGMLSGLGGKLGPAAAGVGLVVGGAFTAGLLNGFEVEATTDKLAAQLGGGEQAEAAGDIAGRLYGDAFGESVAETGAAVRQVIQRHLLPEDAANAQIEKLTERFLTFTDVMEQDMDMSTQAVSRMIKTGIADSGEEALDILTRGVQQGADQAGDLLETFQEYSTMFREVGVSAEDATGLMVQGLQAGARDGDKVADALKEIAIRGQDASETSAEGFEAIGLNAEKMTAKFAAGGPKAREGLDQVLDGLRGMEDPAERNAAAVALFGTQAEDLGDALFALDLDTAAAGLGDVEGATDGLGSAYENASTNIESFRRQALQKLTTFVGNEVVPKLQELGDWAKENPAAFKAIAAVVGGALVVAFTAWAISAASAAVATIAATWPVLAVLALVVGAIALVKIHWDTIKDAAMAVFGWVVDNWPLLLAILTGPIGIAVGLIVSHWDKIWGAGKAVFNWVRDNWPLILAFLTGPIGLAVLAVVRNFDTIKNAATRVKDWIGDRVSDIVGFFTGLPGRVGSVISGVADAIRSPFTSAFDAVRSVWNSTVGGFGFDVPSWVPGVGGKSFKIPSMDVGGVVPGPLGAPQLIVAHGGETVVPTHDRQALTRFTDDFESGPPPASDSGGGDTTVINIDQRGSTFGSGIDFERSVTRALNHARAKGVTLKGRRRTR